MGGTGLKLESWKVKKKKKKMTLKMHLNTIFIAFWKKSETWNLAIAGKVPPTCKSIRTVSLGANYTTGRASLHLAVWLMLGAGWRIYICYLDQTWIRSFTSVSLQTSLLSATHPDHSALFQTACDVRWNVSHAQAYSTATLSVACFGPGMAEYEYTVLH